MQAFTPVPLPSPPCYYASLAGQGTSSDSENSGVAFSETEDVPVLIIGQSMVGMTLTALLAYHGVKSVGVEKHASTAIHPRAALFLTRSLEIFRQIDLEKDVVQESKKLYDLNAGINAVTSLAGDELAVYLRDMNAVSKYLTPAAGRVFLTQHAFEPVLKRHAVTNGARLEFGREVLSVREFEPGMGVEVLVEDLGTDPGREVKKGTVKRYRAQYLVAADGNRSPIRQQLGIAMKGHGVMSESLTIYFRAPMFELVHATDWGKGSVSNGLIYVSNDYVRGFFRLDRHLQGGFLVVNTCGPPGKDSSRFLPPNLSKEGAIKILRSAIGSETVPIEIELVAPWKAVSDNAERYMSPSGRIFLVGDAAHTVLPTGGFGGNTGIADVHNIAWKLAAVLDGKASPELLRSYDAERQLVGHFTVEQAYSRYVNRIAPELEDKGEPERPDYEIEIGYGFLNSPGIVRSEVDERMARSRFAASGGRFFTEDAACPSGLPGFRAPFARLRRADGSITATTDLVQRNFVLFTHASSAVPVAAWHGAAANASRILGGLPVDSHVIMDVLDLERPNIQGRLIDMDVLGKFRRGFGLKEGGCALVRPDGIIAWRSEGAPGPGGIRPGEELAGILKKILFPSGSALATPVIAPTVSAQQPAAKSDLRIDSIEGVSGTLLFVILIAHATFASPLPILSYSTGEPNYSHGCRALHHPPFSLPLRLRPSHACLISDLNDLLYLDDLPFSEWLASLPGTLRPLHAQMLSTWRRPRLPRAGAQQVAELGSFNGQVQTLLGELMKARGAWEKSMQENRELRDVQENLAGVLKGVNALV